MLECSLLCLLMAPSFLCLPCLKKTYVKWSVSGISLLFELPGLTKIFMTNVHFVKAQMTLSYICGGTAVEQSLFGK